MGASSSLAVEAGKLSIQEWKTHEANRKISKRAGFSSLIVWALSGGKGKIWVLVPAARLFAAFNGQPSSIKHTTSARSSALEPVVRIFSWEVRDVGLNPCRLW